MFIINNSMLNMDIKTTQIEKIMYSFFLGLSTRISFKCFLDLIKNKLISN